MKQSEIKELSTAELQEKLGETKKELCRPKNGSCHFSFRKSNSITLLKKKCSKNCNRIN